MSLSRRDLFRLGRPATPPVAVPVPVPVAVPVAVPVPVAAPFSLDGFYAARTAPAALPHFPVHSAATAPTTRVGVGLVAAAPAPAADAAVVPVPPDLVPTVLAHACLATRSFCSVCVERCPRPGAIVVRAGRPHVVADRCDGCGRCVATCPAPVLAFALVPRPTNAP